MTKNKITYKRARNAMLQVLKHKGTDTVVSPRDCKYFTDHGAPCCVVGHVFSQLGYTALDFEGGANKANVNGPAVRERVLMTPKALRFLTSLQGAQDTQKTWGESYIRAETAIASEEL